MRKIPRWLIYSITPILLIFALYWGFWFLFPLQASELSNRYEFWSEGVAHVESGGLHGYVHDTCANAPKGKGCACVALIHGLADNALTWKKVLLWPENGWLEPVKLYAFDLPGSGASPAPTDPSDYRVRKQAARLRAALAPICPHWIVVGNSMGGWIASWLALDWREGVSKVVLLNSAGLKKDEKELAETRAFFEEPSVESMKEFQSRAYFRGRPLPDHVWRAVAARMKESNAKQVIEAQLPEDYLDDRLPALRRPTMVLWGTTDRVIAPEAGKRLQSLIPGSIWNEVKECGHLPQKECPLDVIKAIYQMVQYGAV